MISHYDWSGGREVMLRFGPDTGPVVIAAMPLLGEANRTRAFMVTILRALADRGIAGALPDLPGSGDSLIQTEKVSLSDWQNGFVSAAQSLQSGDRTIHIFAVRGGVLIDGQADVTSRYHFAPTPGANLVREMIRTRLAAAKECGEAFDPQSIAPPGPPVELAGNLIDRKMIADLYASVPSTTGLVRTVRLKTDAQPADRKIAAAPLWRRAEPDNDVALAELLADDIAAWIAQCEA